MPGSLVRPPTAPVPGAGSGSLFESRPIKLAGFHLRAALVHGSCPLGENRRCLAIVTGEGA